VRIERPHDPARVKRDVRHAGGDLHLHALAASELDAGLRAAPGSSIARDGTTRVTSSPSATSTTGCTSTASSPRLVTSAPKLAPRRPTAIDGCTLS